MYSRLVVVAERGRLPRIDAVGALAARVTGADTVHIVGAAATPLGGDEIEIEIAVGPGARLTLRTVAATMAMPGRTEVASAARWLVDVGPDAWLDIDPEPTIVAADARHHVRTVVHLAQSAQVRIRERAQIGRTGESGGYLGARLDVDVDRRPLLRHATELGIGAVSDDVISAHRTLTSEFRYPDDTAAAVAGTNAVRLPLAGGGSLTTEQGLRLVPEALLER